MSNIQASTGGSGAIHTTRPSGATVRDVMTKDVITVRSYATFRQIATTMLSRSIGAVPVVDSIGRVIGVVSRTDLIAKEAAAAGGQSELWELLSRRGREAQARSEAISAGRLMSVNLVTVTPDTGVARAAYLMERHSVSHLPVVDGRDVIIGIVSRSDLLRAYLRADREIRGDVIQAVSASLSEHDVREVGVEVEDGVVTLTGILEHPSDTVEAARAARGVRGVVTVIDRLGAEKADTSAQRPFNPGPIF
jgi:CBS domain-containing protein